MSQAEFHRYRQTMAIEDCKMATKSQLVKKVTDINRLLNHQFTKEELNEKLRKQGTLDNKMHVFKLMETQRKLQAARSAGDEEEIAKMEEAMKEFETPKLAFGTTLHKPRSEQKTSQERIHELNLRNQKLDHENIRRVQLEERKAARKAAAAIARGEMPADPFKRVRTNVRTFYDPNPASSKEESGTSDPSRNATPMTTESPGKPGTPQSTTPSTSQKTDAAKSDAGTSQLRYTSGKDADAARMMAICMEMDINIDEL